MTGYPPGKNEKPLSDRDLPDRSNPAGTRTSAGSGTGTGPKNFAEWIGPGDSRRAVGGFRGGDDPVRPRASGTAHEQHSYHREVVGDPPGYRRPAIAPAPMVTAPLSAGEAQSPVRAAITPHIRPPPARDPGRVRLAGH